MNWQPTHYSKEDGSPARLVKALGEEGKFAVLENEAGDQWEDVLDRWGPAPPTWVGLIDSMAAVVGGEGGHIEADQLLVEALRLAVAHPPTHVQAEDLIDAYEHITKWYA